jgi:hypothetical protein
MYGPKVESGWEQQNVEINWFSIHGPLLHTIYGTGPQE